MEERGARAAAETEAAELEGRLIAAEEAAAANAERAGRAAEAAEAAQDLVSRTMGRREEERAAALEVTEELDALRTRLQAAEAAEVAAAGRATRAAEDSKEEAEARRRAEGSRAEAEAEAQTAVAALAEAEAARAAAEEARAAAEERQAEARVLLGQTVEAAEVEVAKAESATAAAEEVLPASLPALHCRPTADQPPSSRGPGLPCSRRLTVAAYRRAYSCGVQAVSDVRAVFASVESKSQWLEAELGGLRSPRAPERPRGAAALPLPVCRLPLPFIALV